MHLKHRNEIKPYVSIYYTIKIITFKDSHKEESYSIIIKTKEMKERNSRKNFVPTVLVYENFLSVYGD